MAASARRFASRLVMAGLVPTIHGFVD